MPIFLVLVAALAGGEQQCREHSDPESCAAPVLLLADASGVPRATDEIRHIAEVVPAGEPRAKADPAPSPPPKPEPRPAPAPEPVAEVQEIEPSDLEDPWIVQVGAFTDRASAQRGARETGSDDAVIVHTRRDGKDWYVVLLGNYSSYAEADSRGRDHAAMTDGEYWVRDAAGLREIRVPE